MQTVLGEQILQAISLTLLHSLWQGMIMALFIGIMMYCTKKASPSIRYSWLSICFIIFTIVVGLTFINQLRNTFPSSLATGLEQKEAIGINAWSEYEMVNESAIPFTTRMANFFMDHAKWIVLSWLLIITFQFMRLIKGLHNVYQLKNKQVFSAGEYWNNRVSELCHQLHMKKGVRLLQSGLVKMPAVIGYLKPVILFPAAMLTSLPINEVEAVLMHELAHIRRKDFLFNLLQNLLEIVFFFNPAVLWVSSLIRIERENCCDEIALHHSKSKQNYIQALLSFEQFVPEKAYRLAPAFSGGNKLLLNRVKRIIYNKNKTLNNMEKKFLAAALLLTTLSFLAFTQGNTKQNQTNEKIVPETVNIRPVQSLQPVLMPTHDTVPKNDLNKGGHFKGKITTQLNGKNYTLVVNGDHLSELYVNGKRIPDDKMSEYKKITDQLIQQSKIDMEQSEKAMAESEKAMAESEKAMAQSEIEMALSEKAMAQSEKDMAQSRKDMAQSEIEMALSEKALVQSKIDMAQSEKALVQSKIDMAQSEKDMAQSKKDMEQYRKDMEQSRKDMEQSRKDMEQSRILQENVINDLIKERVIKNKKDLSTYQLSDGALIVNGVQQPDDIHKRIKEKYLKNSKSTMNYIYNQY